mmetsp:Transcript_33935/g.56992  ORF Transcript_33935/g.56992 Transcript_33935/m.56992 type:complete len:344 (-) Transcript_33935:450-1481(-)
MRASAIPAFLLHAPLRLCAISMSGGTASNLASVSKIASSLAESATHSAAFPTAASLDALSPSTSSSSFSPPAASSRVAARASMLVHTASKRTTASTASMWLSASLVRESSDAHFVRRVVLRSFMRPKPATTLDMASPASSSSRPGSLRTARARAWALRTKTTRSRASRRGTMRGTPPSATTASLACSLSRQLLSAANAAGTIQGLYFGWLFLLFLLLSSAGPNPTGAASCGAGGNARKRPLTAPSCSARCCLRTVSPHRLASRLVAPSAMTPIEWVSRPTAMLMILRPSSTSRSAFRRDFSNAQLASRPTALAWKRGSVDTIMDSSVVSAGLLSFKYADWILR